VARAAQLPGSSASSTAATAGLDADDLEQLRDAVRKTQKTAAPFHMVISPRGSNKSLAVRGHLADPAVAQGGAALVWWFDFSESQVELARLRAETARARNDFAALVGLIEAAPTPMWFRGPDMKLRLVNSAYVEAVRATSAEEAVKAQTELIESVDGLTAAQVAKQAHDKDLPVERIVQATGRHAAAHAQGQRPAARRRRRRRLRDRHRGDGGAGARVPRVPRGAALDARPAVDRRRAVRRRAAADVRQPAVPADLRAAAVGAARPARVRPLPRHGARRRAAARDARLPGVAARARRWFTAGSPTEDQWTLGDGTHLRIVAQPMPDGGLSLVAEDRSEQLALSAVRDTLLRTRTATFDSLFESLAVFAPDGRMQLWNRRFPLIWGLPDELLDEHPRIEPLLEQIGNRLARPAQRQAIGEVVRAATLDRKQRGGRVSWPTGARSSSPGCRCPTATGC
jgi:PAS domain-containing protein